MTVALMPDVEYVLYDYFVNVATEVAALVSGRIYKAALPPHPQGPLVQLTKIAGRNVIYNPLVLDVSRVQFDCYGGSQRDANRLAETIRSCLDRDMNNYVHADGTIVAAECYPPHYIPDPDWPTDRGGPKPRYMFDCLVTSKLPRPA
jgi:hypothetical protein